MMGAPQGSFARVLEFLQLPKDRERLKRAIRHSSFRVLAEQERKGGFVERSRNADRFFRKGGIGTYRQELSDDLIAMLVERHRPMMTELGYLSADGTLLV